MSTDNTERREYFRVTDYAIVNLDRLSSNESLADLKNLTVILFTGHLSSIAEVYQIWYKLTSKLI